MTTEKMIAIALEDDRQVGKITDQLNKLGIVRVQVLLPEQISKRGREFPEIAVDTAVSGAIGALLGALIVGVTMGGGAGPMAFAAFPFAALASLILGATIGGLSGWLLPTEVEEDSQPLRAPSEEHLRFLVVTADEFTIHKIQKMVQKAGAQNHLFLDQAQ